MSEPIRVLHVFGRLDRGGAETMIINLYRKMDRSKVQFDFIVHTQDTCDFDKEIETMGGKIFKIQRYKGWNHFKYIKEWNNFFKKNQRYKIIHGHIRSTAAIYLKIAKKFGLKTIAHSHSTSSGEGISATIKNFYQYPIRYISDYLFACSIKAGVWLFGKNSINKNNFYILNNAIDVEQFTYNINVRTKIRNELNINNNFVIGHVGRFHPLKNHIYLLDIFNEVYQKDQSAVLLLVGDGTLRNNIEKKATEMGLLENIIFAGVRPDVNYLLQAMDVFVLPSLYEGLPVTLTEAQASGLPCIVSDTITKEISITNLVKYIELDNISEWVNNIIGSKEINNRFTSYEISTSGYDVLQTSKWLTKFYLNLYSN